MRRTCATHLVWAVKGSASSVPAGGYLANRCLLYASLILITHSSAFLHRALFAQSARQPLAHPRALQARSTPPKRLRESAEMALTMRTGSTSALRRRAPVSARRTPLICRAQAANSKPALAQVGAAWLIHDFRSAIVPLDLDMLLLVGAPPSARSGGHSLAGARRRAPAGPLHASKHLRIAAWSLKGVSRATALAAWLAGTAPPPAPRAACRAPPWLASPWRISMRPPPHLHSPHNTPSPIPCPTVWRFHRPAH